MSHGRRWREWGKRRKGAREGLWVLQRRVTGGAWAILYHHDDDCGKSLCFKKAGILWLRALNQWCEVFKVCMHGLLRTKKRNSNNCALKNGTAMLAFDIKWKRRRKSFGNPLVVNRQWNDTGFTKLKKVLQFISLPCLVLYVLRTEQATIQY